MSKSIYEFWIAWPNGTKSRLPVLPGVLNISNGSQNESISISGLGETTIIQDGLAKIITFLSFFPAHESSLVEYPNPSPPWAFVERIEMFKKSKKPIRFLVTGTPINMAVSIEYFSYREGESGVGDIDYDLTMKEYHFITPRKIDVKKPVPPKPRPNTQPVPKTYTVKKDDTLWAIARKYYNNSLQWRKIWEANKVMMIKRDSKNLKQPGHWIYPGQKLVIPA